MGIEIHSNIGDLGDWLQRGAIEAVQEEMAQGLAEHMRELGRSDADAVDLELESDTPDFPIDADWVRDRANQILRESTECKHSLTPTGDMPQKHRVRVSYRKIRARSQDVSAVLPDRLGGDVPGKPTCKQLRRFGRVVMRCALRVHHLADRHACRVERAERVSPDLHELLEPQRQPVADDVIGGRPRAIDRDPAAQPPLCRPVSSSALSLGAVQPNGDECGNEDRRDRDEHIDRETSHLLWRHDPMMAHTGDRRVLMPACLWGSRMDSGWAVVLGAVIALAGSSVIPWIREALASARLRKERSQERLNDAIVELLAINAGMATAVVTANGNKLAEAYSERQRAAARLLLEVPAPERQDIGDVLDHALPSPKPDGDPQALVLHTTHALQMTLVEWVSGELRAADARKRLKDLIGE
ncbi:unnamed protein product [Penicillium discolor]